MSQLQTHEYGEQGLHRTRERSPVQVHYLCITLYTTSILKCEFHFYLCITLLHPSLLIPDPYAGPISSGNQAATSVQPPEPSASHPAGGHHSPDPSGQLTSFFVLSVCQRPLFMLAAAERHRQTGTGRRAQVACTGGGHGRTGGRRSS